MCFYGRIAVEAQNASREKNLPKTPLLRHLFEANDMKLLVFAHIPPPHHGQSYMVKLMLDGFGGDVRRHPIRTPDADRLGIECYHVNARFSKTLEDVGTFQGTKLFLIIFYCFQAIWCRFRHGVENFYYVPAPGKRVAVYRDWLVMFLCRPFFKRVILHWQAAGLGKWLETSVQIRSRAATYRLFRPVDLSIVLSRYNVADAEKLLSRHISFVSNCAPDPCPDYDPIIRSHRRAQLERRRGLLRGAGTIPTGTVSVLFLAHCSAEKGLFAAFDAVVLANRKLQARGARLHLKLLIAGSFVDETEKRQFDELCRQPEYERAGEFLGFIDGAEKQRVLHDAELMCFPTRYLGENQPVSVIEAMAFGLPVLTTRWRSLPEMFPPGYPGLVAGQEAGEIADNLIALLDWEGSESLRQHYLAHFTLEKYQTSLAGALHALEA
jgi:glycosyltransferase involved in cell wall biosynthesis